MEQDLIDWELYRQFLQMQIKGNTVDTFSSIPDKIKSYYQSTLDEINKELSLLDNKLYVDIIKLHVDDYNYFTHFLKF